ncbi:MAG: hypothetical protein ACFFAN_05100 [Promethearchaeota archaeon]
MIFQGIFNILDLYFNEIYAFYNNIDKYFHEKLELFFKERSLELNDLDKEFKEILLFLRNELAELGFEWSEIQNKFSDQFIKIRKKEIVKLNTPIKRYEKKIAPIIYEIFLEKIIDYIVDSEVASIIVDFKTKGFLPIEFIVELRNLKNLFEESTNKMDNLRKYINIRENIIKKFSENKNNIEELEDLKNTQEKLQLTYLIFRIIDFFHLENYFNFSHIKAYIEKNVEEWLISLPLITLRNPDLYFCGIYLANRLSIKINEKSNKIKTFLLNLYEETIDEFEAPIIEATDRLYYYFKSTHLIKLRIPEEKIIELINIDQKYFQKHYLKDLETSQLVVILKIYTYLELEQKIDSERIKAILEEIEQRISPEGIKQSRDGFITSESTYYVIFCYYMRNTLNKLKDYDLLENIISRIYRNLEFLDFSEETNYDLVSELFYSCESLKLFNCIETKQMITNLAKFLFPKEVVDKVLNSENMIRDKTKARFRHLKVDRFTGETIY